MSGEKGLTARSHAYLFGAIAKEVIDAYGEPGIEAIAQGVIKYGRQRGRRMARRTEAAGFETSILNYITYGEWSAKPGEMDSDIPAKNPDVQFLIKKCPWHDVWKENHLLEKYGYLYCKYVDTAIAQGYNPAIQFDILANRVMGDEVCDMRMRQANATKKDEAELAARIKKLGNKAKMPWEYHCAHLYKTMWEVIVSSFGRAGQESMHKALLALEAVCGKEACDVMLKLMNIDFNEMPVYVGING